MFTAEARHTQAQPQAPAVGQAQIPSANPNYADTTQSAPSGLSMVPTVANSTAQPQSHRHGHGGLEAEHPHRYHEQPLQHYHHVDPNAFRSTNVSDTPSTVTTVTTATQPTSMSPAPGPAGRRAHAAYATRAEYLESILTGEVLEDAFFSPHEQPQSGGVEMSAFPSAEQNARPPAPSPVPLQMETAATPTAATPFPMHVGGTRDASTFGPSQFDVVTRTPHQQHAGSNRGAAAGVSGHNTDHMTAVAVAPSAELGAGQASADGDGGEVYFLQSEVDPTRTLQLAQPPLDTIREVFESRAFISQLCSVLFQVSIFETISFFLTRVARDATDWRLATTADAIAVPLFLAIFTSVQIAVSRLMMRKIRSGEVRGIRMSALNDTWWKRIFFFFADTKTLMRKWPLAVLNSLLIPGIPIALYIVLGCAIFGDGGVGTCESSLAGELLFGISWKVIGILCIIPSHYVSCCNVEHVWNQVNGLALVEEEREKEKARKALAHTSASELRRV